MGQTKIQKEELGKLTEAIRHNPYIQEVKMNDKHMTKKAKDLMKSELAKNRQIADLGNTEFSREERGTIKELDLKHRLDGQHGV